MSLFELYLRSNYITICAGFVISGVLCSGLGLLLIPEKWWAFPAGGALAFFVLEMCHYIKHNN